MNGQSKQPRQSAPLSSKLNNNLAAYKTAAGAAGVGILALTQFAQAKVIYTPTYAKITDLYSLDLNHDGIRDFTLLKVRTCSSRTCGSEFIAYLSGGPNVVLGTTTHASALRAGAIVGPTGHFLASNRMIMVEDYQVQSSSAPVNWNGQFANGGKGVRDRYLGLKFVVNGETHYGWARFSVGIPDPKHLTFNPILTGYAYETEPNKPIAAGQKTSAAVADETIGIQVAAPARALAADLGLLACGADALTLWRREEVSA
jgi:hypothetical protein